MGDYSPVYQGTPPFPATASAAVVGGQLVEATTTGAVGPAGANSLKVVGVAAFDAATGARVTVHPIPGNIHETVTPGGSAVGDTIAAAAAGAVATAVAGTAAAAGYDLGIATTTASAGNKVRWIGK